LYANAGLRRAPDYLNDLWNRWREATELRGRHGLRATAVDDRHRAGTPDIADQLGISTKMVARYVRFADKAASARASRTAENKRRSRI
jgi:hypothetical protein